MKLSEAVRDFENYYATWKREPSVQPSSYILADDKNFKLYRVNAEDITNTIKSLHKLLKSEKALILEIDRRYPSFDTERYLLKRVMSKSDMPLLNAILVEVNRHFPGLSAVRFATLNLALRYMHQNFVSKAKGVNPATVQFYISARELFSCLVRILFRG